MTALDLTHLKALAQAAQARIDKGENLTQEIIDFSEAATPAVVQELIARLKRAEIALRTIAGASREVALRDLKQLATRALDMDGDVDNIVVCEHCYVVMDATHQLVENPDPTADRDTTPNDPLDDVLPLPGMRIPIPDGAIGVRVYSGITGALVHEAYRQPKILPDNLPASLDLDDTEGGSHD